MIKLSIFAGPLESANLHTRLAWLDLAYHEVKPYANYKTCLFQNGLGCSPTVMLRTYPRWSSSIWDLMARAISLCLNTLKEGEGQDLEVLPEPIGGSKAIAFADEISATVEHHAGGKVTRIRTVCTMSIKRGRKKGSYVASLTDNMGQSFDGIEVVYRPSVFQPALLVAKVACQHLHGDSTKLPARPLLVLPRPQDEEGYNWICVHAVREPAKSGFLRWLSESKIPLITSDMYGEVVDADYYAQFLTESL